MKKFILMSIIVCFTASCCTKEEASFTYKVDKFADMEILRYQVPGFEALSLEQKELVYYLSEAALYGRDILFDQNCRYNLLVRHTLEAIYQYGEREQNDANWAAFDVYLKRIWVSNGIHHHYATDKFVPNFSQDFFTKALNSVPQDKLAMDKAALTQTLLPIIFDSKVAGKRVNQADGEDLLLTSANNYYLNVSQKEAEKFYADKIDAKDLCPISYGLNSRLVKENGQLKEQVWKIDGMYGSAIEKIVYYLEKAQSVAENAQQAAIIARLIEYYRSGDLKTFDEYSVLWVNDQSSKVDFVNGFIENYGDPIGLKASWESIVNFKNEEASHRTQVISQNAQWFEDNAPIDSRFKKKEVKGISAKVITAAILGGDCYPTTPIGINLPNADWIRRDHGSKSVTIENITDAYNKAAENSGYDEEFMWSKKEIEQSHLYGSITNNLHTDLHECIGHASGQLLEGTDPNSMKSYASTMEEARADLFALYFLADEKLVELGILPNKDAYKAQYYEYMMNGSFTQLRRIEPGSQIEESHMRNRAMIANWVLEKGGPSVVEMKQRGGKTFLVVHDYKQLRKYFGEMLAEVQRCKSEGDYAAAQQLVENYGVKVNADLHKEVLQRYEKLEMAPYKGFVNPVYTPVYDAQGHIIDVTIDYSEGYAEQHLRYSKQYATLPVSE